MIWMFKITRSDLSYDDVHVQLYGEQEIKTGEAVIRETKTELRRQKMLFNNFSLFIRIFETIMIPSHYSPPPPA